MLALVQPDKATNKRVHGKHRRRRMIRLAALETDQRTETRGKVGVARGGKAHLTHQTGTERANRRRRRGHDNNNDNDDNDNGNGDDDKDGGRVCWVWRRKSFSSAMLQDSLQRSTAGRPQLRGLTEPGEQRTPRPAV